MMKKIDYREMLYHIGIPLLIMALSICVLSDFVPERKFMKTTMESIEQSQETIFRFTGATTAASLAISALPDDFATPLADNFAGMHKYFLLILMALFIEKLILSFGIKYAFLYVIPLACVLYSIGHYSKGRIMQILAKKLMILALALIFVVPCSVKFSDSVAQDYLQYVEETIEYTDGGASKINDEMDAKEEEQTLFERLSDAFKTAIQGITGILKYFEDLIKRCMNSIAILMVTNMLIPVLTLFLFKWLLGELFSLTGISALSEKVCLGKKRRDSNEK